MDTHLVIQAGSIVVSILLLITFYLLFTVGLIDPQNVITPMILIVIAVICLGIFSTLARIEKKLGGKK